MKIHIAVVGRPKNEALAAAIAMYEARAARYWPFEVSEVKEERGTSLTPAQVMEREGERLLSRIGTAPVVVACDPGGRSMTSEAFSKWLLDHRERARDVVFVIGGAHGLSPAVRNASAIRLSLAPWTLPHELARLVLAEQIYRAGTIVRGEPYHKL